MRKAILLILALSAMAAAVIGSWPRPAAADSCFWYCSNGSVFCSCPNPRSCPWPPPPIACD